MPRAPRMKPTCHPDRSYAAHGMCDSCYHVAYRRARTNRIRERDIDVQRPLPPLFDERLLIPHRALTLRQNAVTSFPIDACRKCGNTTIEYNKREAHCPLCGTSVWLVKDLQPA